MSVEDQRALRDFDEPDFGTKPAPIIPEEGENSNQEPEYYEVMDEDITF